jgi:hypothetical protein
VTALRDSGVRSRWDRVRDPVLLAGVVLLVALALHVRDPHRSGSWGFCPWLLLTGTYCPGCGGLRAVNDLTDGDLRAALSSNALVVCSLPVVVVRWGRAVRQRWRGEERRLPAAVVGGLATSALVLTVAFWVLRNLPVGAWLAP